MASTKYTTTRDGSLRTRLSTRRVALNTSSTTAGVMICVSSPRCPAANAPRPESAQVGTSD